MITRWDGYRVELQTRWVAGELRCDTFNTTVARLLEKDRKQCCPSG